MQESTQTPESGVWDVEISVLLNTFELNKLLLDKSRPWGVMSEKWRLCRSVRKDIG
jgi:hypothetical protein